MIQGFKVLLLISFVYFLSLFIWFMGVGSVALNKERRIRQDHRIWQEHALFLLVPALNEKEVIAQTITTEVAELKKLPKYITPHLIVIDDASSDGTTALLRQMDESLLDVVYRIRPFAQQGKGAALNYAFRVIQEVFHPDHNTIYGILDADGYMKVEDLVDVVHNFESRPVELIQTNIGMNNDQESWMTRAQDFEFLANNALIQSIRNLCHTAISSGNGQFMKQVYLDHVTWGDSLLEDCEFTIRGFLKGYRTYFLKSAVVYQQAITQINPLVRQRTRWCQGSMQCLPKYFQAIVATKKMNWLQKVDVVGFLLAPFIGMVLVVSNGLALIYQLWIMALFHDYLVVFTLVFGMILFWCYMMWAYKKEVFLEKAFAAFSFLLMNLLLSLVPFKAVLRQVTHQKVWVKTSHSVKTTSE